jgi:hypothetical protein
LKVKIENGRVAKALVTCPTSSKDLKTDVLTRIKVNSAESKVPAEMVGKWFFDNPHGEEKQIALRAPVKLWMPMTGSLKIVQLQSWI